MKLKQLIIAIVICQLAGIIGSLFTISSIPTWYSTLVKPSFTPPNWLFGPVWITLYTLMGIAVYWIYTSKKKNKNALLIFGVQLLLNTVWSIVFFGFHEIFYGLVIIILLWISIILTILEFLKISKNSGYILVPYLAWVSLATILNYYLWILN